MKFVGQEKMKELCGTRRDEARKKRNGSVVVPHIALLAGSHDLLWFLTTMKNQRAKPLD